MEYMAAFINQEDLHHTFWTFNPNSGDTGGIMLDDWNTLDTAKYNIVEQTLWKVGGKYVGLDHEINLGKDGTGTTIGAISDDTTPTPAATPTPDPATPEPTGEPTGGDPGDVNGDGNVDIVDALLTAQYYGGLDPAGFDVSVADVNCDGGVDIVDALLIARYYVGLISGFC